MVSFFIKGWAIVFFFIIVLTFVGSAIEPAKTTNVKQPNQDIIVYTRSVASIDPDLTFSLFPQQVGINLNDEFTINIAVENATDMYGWQISLRYDPTQLEFINLSLPSNHVFSNAYTVCDALDEYYPSEFSCPIQQHASTNDTRVRFVCAGNCLLGSDQSTFNGSGILCRIEFKAISPGTSTLKLVNDPDPQSFQTFILNHEINEKTAPSETYCNISVE